MMKIKRKNMVVWPSGLRNDLRKNMYLKKLGGLRRDRRCSMKDDANRTARDHERLNGGGLRLLAIMLADARQFR